MNLGTFIAKNALRNKRRAALTILSVAISCALLDMKSRSSMRCASDGAD